MFDSFHMMQLFYWKFPVKEAAAYSGITPISVTRHYRFYRRCVSHWIQNSYYNRFRFPMPYATQWDESAFGKRLHHRGRHRVTSWILGGTQHATSLCFMQCVRRRNAGTLLPIITQHTHYGQYCYTDGWGAYRALGAWG